jgi:hypothetical protein
MDTMIDKWIKELESKRPALLSLMQMKHGLYLHGLAGQHRRRLVVGRVRERVAGRGRDAQPVETEESFEREAAGGRRRAFRGVTAA